MMPECLEAHVQNELQSTQDSAEPSQAYGASLYWVSSVVGLLVRELEGLKV